MLVQEVREYILSKKGATESYPFKMGIPVFKVGGKMFALFNAHEQRKSINLRYNKDDIEALRSSFEGITPGYHMNKKHWNTVYLDSISDKAVKDLIDVSYNLVYNSLSKEKKKDVDEL